MSRLPQWAGKKLAVCVGSQVRGRWSLAEGWYTEPGKRISRKTNPNRLQESGPMGEKSCWAGSGNLRKSPYRSGKGHWEKDLTRLARDSEKRDFRDWKRKLRKWTFRTGQGIFVTELIGPERDADHWAAAGKEGLLAAHCGCRSLAAVPLLEGEYQKRHFYNFMWC